MSASIPPTRPSTTENLSRRMVQKECEVFEASGSRSANLQTLHETLLTIQPTSVEAKRDFSACGFLSPNCGPVYTIQRSMLCALYEMRCRNSEHC